jgi:hypothetical protein
VELAGEFCVFLRDYNSRELTVEAGDPLDVELEEGGWALALNSRGERGWVPMDRIVPESDCPA